MGGLALVLHYAWLMDDAYIYFRYVDNWVLLGHGLVFNQGEYVEGYSSPLWALLLGALRATGLPYWTIIRGIGVASFVAFFALVVAVNRALSPAGSRTLDFPVLFLSLNYAVASYFTSGTESALVLVTAACYGLFVMRPGSGALQISVGLSPLLRHELALPFAIVFAWAWWRTGRPPWRMGAVCGASLLAWTLFRVYYYADFLPNTFYLKNLIATDQGFQYLHDTLAPYHLYAVVASAVIALVVLRLRRKAGVAGRDIPLHVAERCVMLAAAIVVAAYVIKIGGDSRHFRYLGLPVVLTLCATGGIAESALRAYDRSPSRALLAIAAVAIAAFAFSFHPRQLSRHPILGDETFELVDKISDAAHHRHHPRLPRLSGWEDGRVLEQKERYPSSTSGQGGKQDSVDTVVDHLCFQFYRDFDLHGIHSLGLTDPILARTPQMRQARPGHNWKLKALAGDLADVHRLYAAETGSSVPGNYRRAVEEGAAAPWIAANLEVIEVIERKIYNRHHFGENLRLAFTFPDPIQPGSAVRRRARREPGASP